MLIQPHTGGERASVGIEVIVRLWSDMGDGIGLDVLHTYAVRVQRSVFTSKEQRTGDRTPSSKTTRG